MVAADAAVLDAGIGQQFVPLAAVGDAVAQEYDVLGGHGQFLEERTALEIVLALREDGGCGEEQQGGQNRFFHFGESFLFVSNIGFRRSASPADGAAPPAVASAGMRPACLEVR